MRPYFEFVASELRELESRDPDQLFECLKDNLEEMRVLVNETDLYNEIECQIEAERRADECAKGGIR